MRFGQLLGGCRLAAILGSPTTPLLLLAPQCSFALLGSVGGRTWATRPSSETTAFAGSPARFVAMPPAVVNRFACSPSAVEGAAGGNDNAARGDSFCGDPLVRMGLPSPLVLGSGSFTRKLILKEMGIDYEIVVRPIDEKGLGDRDGDPSELVMTLAEAKADHLVSYFQTEDDNGSNEEGKLPEKTFEGDYGGYVVLTADQVVTHAGSILEKPESIEEARKFVEGYASSPPATVGACVLTHLPSGARASGVDSATINFRPTVSEGDLVGNLVEDGAAVLSCAGGLMVEHALVKEHIESIDGTEDSVMGLSKDLVLRLLAELRDKLRSLA